MPQATAVEEEVASIHTENQALHKQQAALGNEVRTLKQQAAQLTDDIAAEKCKLGNVTADCDRLRGQIVQVSGTPCCFSRSVSIHNRSST